MHRPAILDLGLRSPLTAVPVELINGRSLPDPEKLAVAEPAGGR